MAKTSEVMAGLGFLTDFLPALRKRVKELGGKDEDIALVTEQEGMPLVTKFAELIVQAGNVLRNIFSILVDYSQSLADMISAGKYDWVNSNITANHFPLDKSGGKVEFESELVHYGKNMTSEQVLADLDSRGLRPALLPELLAFGAKYPDKQREFPIIALGSKWQDPDGDLFVAYLDGDGSERDLYLIWFDSVWVGYCRFLAARKS